MNQDQSHDTTQGAQGAMTYQEQPVGIPDSTPITLERDGAWDVFNSVLHAVQSWEDSEDPFDQDDARLRLIRDLDALRVMTRALRASDAPYIQAHIDDARAAEEWRKDRWHARGDRARAERAAAIADSGAKEA